VSEVSKGSEVSGGVRHIREAERWGIGVMGEWDGAIEEELVRTVISHWSFVIGEKRRPKNYLK
jgi:hypothetical protein